MTLLPVDPADPRRQRSVGPVDSDRMQAAAEELRERTMSFEPPSAPTPWLFLIATTTLVVVLVGLLFAYRRPLLALLRGAGY